MTTFLVQHITGGDAFFTGIVLLGGAVILARRANWRRTRGVSLCVIVGALLIAASATPLPWWLYGLLTTSVIVWFALLGGRRVSESGEGSSVSGDAPAAAAAMMQQRPGGHRPLLLSALLVLMLQVVTGWELRWRFTPRVAFSADDTLIVLADSVTAGIGEREAVRWPELLSDRHPGLTIDDRSKMGATVGSVLKLIEERPLEDGVVLIEIGGNDLLGSTSLAAFEADLDSLLSLATADGRQCILFELPLPPGSNSWGQIQRRLANAHGVALIPKRRFAAILLSGETTLDSIHLSQAGHEQMAELMEEVLVLDNTSQHRTASRRSARLDDAVVTPGILYPFYGNGEWGYINDVGETIVEPTYKDAFDFADERAIAFSGHHMHCIDSEGAIVWETDLSGGIQHYKEYSDQRFWYSRSDHLVGCVDLDGHVVIPFQYGDVRRFRDNVAVVSAFDPDAEFDPQFGEYLEYGDSGLVDTNGEFVLPMEYASIEVFDDGVVLVRRDETSDSEFVDLSGNVLLTESELENLVEHSDWYVGRSEYLGEGRYGIRICEHRVTDYTLMVDEDANVVAGPFVGIGEFSEGLATAAEGEYPDGKLDRSTLMRGFITPAGEFIPLRFDEVNDFHQNLCLVQIGEEWMFINHNFDVVLRGDADVPWNDAEDFNGPLARVHVGGTFHPAEFHEGSQWEGGEWFYINRAGEIVATCRPDFTNSSFGEFRRFGREFPPN